MREAHKNKNKSIIKSKDEIIREMESMIWMIIIITLLFLLIIIYYIGKEQTHEQDTYQGSPSVSNIVG